MLVYIRESVFSSVLDILCPIKKMRNAGLRHKDRRGGGGVRQREDEHGFINPGSLEGGGVKLTPPQFFWLQIFAP